METKDKKRRSALCVALLHRVLLQRNAPLLNNTSAILSGLFGRKDLCDAVMFLRPIVGLNEVRKLGTVAV